MLFRFFFAPLGFYDSSKIKLVISSKKDVTLEDIFIGGYIEPYIYIRYKVSFSFKHPQFHCCPEIKTLLNHYRQWSYWI